MPATDLKDKRVKHALMTALETGSRCKAAFNSIEFGIEDVDNIKLSQCPALRVGFSSMAHDRARVSLAKEDVLATYRAFVIIKNPQTPAEAEDMILDAMNAVRLDLHADTSLGGEALDCTSTTQQRDHSISDEIIDVVEMVIMISYTKNPVTGL